MHNYTNVLLACISFIRLVALAGLGPVFGNALFAAPQTYYLDPNGDDAKNGKSPATAWKTLNKACPALTAGDTLIVRGGAYLDNYCHASASGTQTAPITIKAYPGEVPILSGNPTYNVFLNIFGSWYVIDGIHIQNTSAATNVQVNITTGTHVTVRNCAFKYNAGGTMIIVGGGSYATIENNTFDTTGRVEDSGQGSHIYVRGSHHVLIQNNYFARAGHAAVDFINLGPNFSHHSIVRNNLIDQRWGGGIYLILGSHDIVVENNKIFNVGDRVNYPKVPIQVAAETNIVRRNILAFTSVEQNDHALDLSAYQNSGIGQNVRDNRIYNNVIYKSGGVPILITQRHSSEVTRNKLVNNIIYYNKVAGPQNPYPPHGTRYIEFETFHAHAGHKWTSFPNGNYFYNNILVHADARGDRPGEDRLIYYGQDPWGKSLARVQKDYPKYFWGNIEKNPKFANADQSDFSLAANSPAIDAGASLAKTTAAGSGTAQVPVDDPYFFTDGYGLVPGDIVRVGKNPPVTVTTVDNSRSVLTVSSPLSFAAGDAVNLDYAGLGPDIGAVENGASSSGPAFPRTPARAPDAK